MRARLHKDLPQGPHRGRGSHLTLKRRRERKMPTYHQFIKEKNSKESRKCNEAFIRIAGICVTGPFL